MKHCNPILRMSLKTNKIRPIVGNEVEHVSNIHSNNSCLIFPYSLDWSGHRLVQAHEACDIGWSRPLLSVRD